MKRIPASLALLFCLASAAGAEPAADPPGLGDSLRSWRHHIHRNPELSFEEHATSRYVAERLSALGNIEVMRPTPTSVLGVLKGGREGPRVAFRADMDALPVEERTDFAFASRTPGVSHACGHDMHAAMLLGTAYVLSTMQAELPGTLFFIFQHAEEKAPGGAGEIIASGALDGVEAVFGAHVIAGYPAGSIGILPAGAASTAADGFLLTIEGKGSHGSMPQLGVDPIVTGAEVVMALQTIVSRSVSPDEMAVVSVGKFCSGDAPNVIPDRAEIAASIRSTTPQTRQLIERRVRALVDAVCKGNGADYKLDYVKSYPAIDNDASLRDLARRAAVEAVGAERVFDAPRLSASEDFAYYARIAPVYFFIIGAGEGPANHNPGFRADDAAMPGGVRTQVQVIRDFLESRR